MTMRTGRYHMVPADQDLLSHFGYTRSRQRPTTALRKAR